MSSKNTPTPFRQTKRGFEIKDESGNLVGICTEKEHAAFIVRTCNDHKELVEIVETLIAMTDPHDMNPYVKDDIAWARSKAQSILAKAKEERKTSNDSIG